MRGRRRKSPELEAAQGFPGKRRNQTQRLLQVEHGGAGGSPLRETAPPAWLSPEGVSLWKSFVEDPALAWTFKRSDGVELARYCDNLSRYLSLHAQIGSRVSYVAKNSAGSKRRYIKPEYREMVALGKELRNQASALGLNPQARLSINSKIASGTSTSSGAPSTAPHDTDREGPIGVLKIGRYVT